MKIRTPSDEEFINEFHKQHFFAWLKTYEKQEPFTFGQARAQSLRMEVLTRMDEQNRRTGKPKQCTVFYDAFSLASFNEILEIGKVVEIPIATDKPRDVVPPGINTDLYEEHYYDSYMRVKGKVVRIQAVFVKETQIHGRITKDYIVRDAVFADNYEDKLDREGLEETEVAKFYIVTLENIDLMVLKLREEKMDSCNVLIGITEVQGENMAFAVGDIASIRLAYDKPAGLCSGLHADFYEEHYGSYNFRVKGRVAGIKAVFVDHYGTDERNWNDPHSSYSVYDARRIDGYDDDGSYGGHRPFDAAYYVMTLADAVVSRIC